MYFQIKTILKNNYNHSPKHTINLGLSMVSLSLLLIKLRKIVHMILFNK
jgi:hypothetical protein